MLDSDRKPIGIYSIARDVSERKEAEARQLVLLRELHHLKISKSIAEAIIDFHCTVSIKHEIYFLWRPHLRDAGDDMVLELALAAGCKYIVTYNKRDFAGAGQFGIEAIDPATLYWISRLRSPFPTQPTLAALTGLLNWFEMCCQT